MISDMGGSLCSGLWASDLARVLVLYQNVKSVKYSNVLKYINIQTLVLTFLVLNFEIVSIFL